MMDSIATGHTECLSAWATLLETNLPQFVFDTNTIIIKLGTVMEALYLHRCCLLGMKGALAMSSYGLL